jgi:energy-coupling factor transporter ATP-binding protein EcfA2
VEEPTQRVDAGRDAYVAGGDIGFTTLNFYLNDEMAGFRPPFLVVDELFLGEERKKPKIPYIARPPLWADVVDGQNAYSRFLEREQFGTLVSSIDRELLDPLRSGSDRRLRTLFVTGAPGCGKSTLVRHAAAALVERGDIIVADLGVNHGRLIADDLDFYLKGLTQLAADGKPVLLLMDDPFFANSGWDLLLETLARPNYSGIAVIGATPTYLYETYGRLLAGHQVVLKTFPLGSTTSNERQLLAEMYGVGNDPSIHRAIGRHEELLVFAMETASGSSFSEIIERIWSTLNDGRAIGPKTAVADVEWPVMAFLLTSYLHQHYVMCPESLLRAFLLDLAANTQMDFTHELSELTVSEGWHIFRVSRANSGASGPMIGTMHPRVAERAWRVRPFKALDHVGLLARASARAPECAPQLAEFILTCQPQQDPADRGLALRVAEQWQHERVSTAQLSALVRGLSATPAAMTFRGMLRERLKVRDSQSWLAAAELVPLTRHDPVEHEWLSRVELPYVLTIADLSADSLVAIELIGPRESPTWWQFADTVCASLRGELAWKLDGRLLTWLLHNCDAAEIQVLLPRIYDWLDAHQKEERARVALIRWYADHVARLESGEISHLLDRMPEWISLHPGSRNIRSSFFILASLLLQGNYSLSPNLITEISSWLAYWPDDSFLRERFLRLMAQHHARAPDVVSDAVIGTQAWLTINPDAGDVRRALLDLVLVEPAHLRAAQCLSEALTWLGQHPSDGKVRDTWTAVLQALPVTTVSDATVNVLAWLGDHQEEPDGRRAVLILARGLSGHPERKLIVSRVRGRLTTYPDGGSARAGFLALIRKLPRPPDLAGIIADARRWILDLPNDAKVRGAFLALVRNRPGYIEPREVIAQTMAWLADRPDDEEGHLMLLRLARGMPSGPEAAQAIAATVRWLDGHRGGNETWIALFSLVRAAPGHPQAAEACTQARLWLARHPEDSHIRTALLGYIRALPGHPQAAEVIAETFDWLEENPDDVNVRSALSPLARELAGSPALRELLTQARARLRDNPDNPDLRERMLALACDLVEPAGAAELITETREWLRSHPDSPRTWVALLRLAQSARQYPKSTEMITEARLWLAWHPRDFRVRASLLGLIRALPGRPEAAEVIADTLDWLDWHGDTSNVGQALLSLQRAETAPAKWEETPTLEGITEAWARLAHDPGNANARVHLLAMVRALPTYPRTPEIITEIRQWLDDHPEDSHVRHAFLVFLRALPDSPGVPEIVTEIRRWLDEHSHDTHVRTGLIALIAALPDDPQTADFIAGILGWLDEFPEQVPTRTALLALIQKHREHPHAVEAIAQTHAWLTDNPHEHRVGSSLLAVIHALPESLRSTEIVDEALRWLDEHSGNFQSRSGRRTRQRRSPTVRPERPAPEELSRARAWLNEHADDADAHSRVLNLIRDLPEHPNAAETIAETRRWIAAHPHETAVRAALFDLSLLVPHDPIAAEAIPETFRWLSSNPKTFQFPMTHFFAALYEVPNHPKIDEVIDAVRGWLNDCEDAYLFRGALLRLVRAVPESPVAAEVVLETRLWLLDHDDDSPTRVSLLALMRTIPDYPEAIEVVRETRSWLASHPGRAQVRQGLLALLRRLSDDPEVIEIARESCDWLARHPGMVQVRCALLALMRNLSEHPEALDSAREARDWLAAHPEAHSVREALLVLVRDLPGNPPLVAEVLSEAHEWFTSHPHNTHRLNVLKRILDLAKLWPDSPVTRELITETHAWLAASRGHPQYENVLACLTGLKHDLPGAEGADQGESGQST